MYLDKVGRMMFSVMLVLDYDYIEKGPPSNLEPITVIKSDGGHATLKIQSLPIPMLIYTI